MSDYFNQPARSQGAGDADSTPLPETPTEAFPSIPIEQVLTRQATTNAAQTPSGSDTRPSIRIRRLPSSRLASTLNASTNASDPQVGAEDAELEGRRRSASLPQRPQRAAQPNLRRQATEAVAAATSGTDNLPSVAEEPSSSDSPNLLAPESAATARARASSNAGRSISVRSRQSSNASRPQTRKDYDGNVVDMLDVIDPEVSTLNTLNNIQNSLFVPYLGRFFDRRQTYNLSRSSSDTDSDESTNEPEPATPAPLATIPSSLADPGTQDTTRPEADDQLESLEPVDHSHTLSSVLSGTSIGHNYAVLPHGTILEDWSDEDKAELDDYVRHLLHSRRAAFKRKMKGFGKFVSKPLGFIVTLWAFLITFWGAAWVLFLIGWIYVGDRQQYFIEICDQILTALFCIVGIGMSPFRAVDTYHMIWIAKYHYKTWEVRRKQELPDLTDNNDLPQEKPDTDVELARSKNLETTVLTPEQQKRLVHHQNIFAKSHTFYRPHETFTHNAFPIKLLITVVVLLDCHSLFQMALGGTTWGIYYKNRPRALTAAILSCSITCNISAGICISIGDRISRKKQVVEQIFRQTLTAQAMHKIEKEKGLHSRKKPEAIRQEQEEKKQKKEDEAKGVLGHITHPHTLFHKEERDKITNAPPKEQ